MNHLVSERQKNIIYSFGVKLLPQMYTNVTQENHHRQQTISTGMQTFASQVERAKVVLNAVVGGFSAS